MKHILINDDCLKSLDDFICNRRRFDCIITSPPYNLRLRIHTGKYIRMKKEKSKLSQKYEDYEDNLSMEEYFHFQKTFIEKALKVSDKLFYNIQCVTGNKVALFKLFGHFADKIKEIIIWDKINAQPAINTNTLNSQFEFIIVFENSTAFLRKFNYVNFKRGSLSNLWSIKRERNIISKASFPKELVRMIITNFTREQETVLDPFMGSGTTGLVCQELNRNFVGIEISKATFEKARTKFIQN